MKTIKEAQDFILRKTFKMDQPLNKKSYEFKTTSDVILNGDFGKYNIIQIKEGISIEFKFNNYEFSSLIKKINDTEIKLITTVNGETLYEDLIISN